jgi:anaerobic selenocysteine-containing dehydrogenase
MCGMDVYVEEGKIVGIKGTKDHPYSHGYLCSKGLAAGELVSSPLRLKKPLKRTGQRGEGKWEEITWDKALDEIAEKLLRIKDQCGPNSIAFARGTGPGWEGSLLYDSRFMFALGSGNLTYQVNLCKGIRVVSAGTTMGGEPEMDLENTKLIVLWGSNPAATSVPNYWSRISKAKSRGVKLVCIDPRFSRSASKADLHVRIRPGTDGALALGLAHVIIKEELYDKEFVESYSYGFKEYAALANEFPPARVESITGVPSELITRLARLYGGTKPAVLFVGQGLEHATNTIQTARAIYCLVGLTGNFGIQGGHILHKPLPLPDLALKSKFYGELMDQSVCRHKFYHSKLGPMPSVTYPDLFQTISTDQPYPIKALLCIGSAFLTTYPEGKWISGLMKDKLALAVVGDLFMSREARELADYVLPINSFLETWRFRFQRPGFKGNAYIQWWAALGRPVVQSVGESKPSEEVLTLLAHRLGLSEYFPWKNVPEYVDELLKPLGKTGQQLVDHPEGLLWTVPQEEIASYKKDGFGTPTKKFEFYNKSFEQAGFDPLPRYEEGLETPISRPDMAKDYPLIASIGIKPLLFHHTVFRNIPLMGDQMPEPWVEIHPDKARELEINEGDMVEVSTRKGKVVLSAKITLATMDSGVVFLPYAWEGINDLVDVFTMDPICGAPTSHALLCKVRKI